jgi:large subunit ribosomal protein L1
MAEIMTLDEAIKASKEGKSAKFKETIEAHFKLKPSKEKGREDLRFLFEAPHFYGKEPIIVALTSKVESAKKAGAKYAGGEDAVAKIDKGKIKFDIIVAEPKMMGLLKPLAKDLGRSGRMPTDKAGTLTDNVVEAVESIKKGRREIRSDAQGGVHFPVGKVDTEEKEIKENITELKNAVASHRPIESLTLALTMGKAIRVDLTLL